MNDAIVPQIKRRRGRPRKNVNQPAINKFPTFIPQTNISSNQRKQITENSEDIQVIGFNGHGEESLAKKPKLDGDDDGNSKRHLPPRRARFTESYGGAKDVVVLSDNDDSESESDSDCEPIPSPIVKVRSKVEQEEYEANIERLKKELSDEEMKLVLLRKLKDSQKSKEKKETSESPLPTPMVNVSQKSAVTSKSGVQIAPLPSKQLITNNKFFNAKKDLKQDAQCSLSKPSPSLFKPIQSSFKPAIKPMKTEPTSSVSSTVTEQLNSSHLNQYPLLKNLSNQITITPVPLSTSSNTKTHTTKQEDRNDSDTLQQRQAAAKLALRKQLEKTLLQIPLPKPPPLKINFFPNPNSIEFLCLLGLDFIVDFMTKTKKPQQKEPLTCAQCSTDFTCAWKWKEVDKNGKKAYDVFCEACITSNIRKALKAQHTNNLKSAFLKALQQEKEIDRLSLSALPKVEREPMPQQPLPRQSSTQSSSSRSSRPAPAHQHSSNSNVSAFTVPKTAAPLPYIPKSAGMNPAAALAQLSKLSPQYQSLLQAQAQQLLAAGVPLHPSVLSLSPFMPQAVLNHNHHGRNKSKGDGRRQHYRSERVQSPSIPQASSSWKA